MLLAGGPGTPAAGIALAVPGQSSRAPPAAVAAQQQPGAAWADGSRVPDRMRSWAPGASSAASPGRSQRALLGPPDAEQQVGGNQAPGAAPFQAVVQLKALTTWAAAKLLVVGSHDMALPRCKQPVPGEAQT